jgi:hypothetical protein
MPIPDPGNAGTAGSRDNWPEPDLTEHKQPRARDDDPRRRATSLATALITGPALIGGTVATLVTGDWVTALIAAVAWISALIVAVGVISYRHGTR